MIKTKPFLECETWAELWAANDAETKSFLGFPYKSFKRMKRDCLYNRALYIMLRDRNLDELVEQVGEEEAKKISEKVLTEHGVFDTI